MTSLTMTSSTAESRLSPAAAAAVDLLMTSALSSTSSTHPAAYSTQLCVWNLNGEWV